MLVWRISDWIGRCLRFSKARVKSLERFVVSCIAVLDTTTLTLIGKRAIFLVVFLYLSGTWDTSSCGVVYIPIFVLVWCHVVIVTYLLLGGLPHISSLLIVLFGWLLVLLCGGQNYVFPPYGAHGGLWARAFVWLFCDRYLFNRGWGALVDRCNVVWLVPSCLISHRIRAFACQKTHFFHPAVIRLSRATLFGLLWVSFAWAHRRHTI